MARRISKLVLAAAALAVCAVPAVAQNYDELSRSDFISLSAGNAAQSNISIQTPTPWPSYVNDTHFHADSRVGLTAIENLIKRYQKGSEPPPPSTVINIGSPAQ